MREADWHWWAAQRLSALVRVQAGYFSSTNLEESSWSDELSASFDPTSCVTKDPTPSEESCLKRASGSRLARSRRSSSSDWI